MEIRHLKLVQTVAATGNLTRAAEQLYLSQSALSHQLRELEEEYKTQFFVRARRQMVLTPAGERLLATADKVLCELEKTEVEIARLNNDKAGLLRITTGCYTCYHWLSPALSQYRKEFPSVSIEIIPEASYDPFPHLLGGRVDLVLSSDFVEDANLEYHHLFEDEMIALLSPEHSLAGNDFIRAQDFEHHPLLMYNIPDQNSTVLSDYIKPSGVKPFRILRLQLTEAVMEMAKAGMGIAILAEWAARPYLERGELAGLPLDRPIHRDWYAVVLKNLRTPPYMKAFIEALGKSLNAG